MYVDDVDFYSLSTQKQRRLLRKNRVATTNGILTVVPDEQPAVRIFEKPLEQLVLDRLKKSQFTISELADEFGVEDQDVRKILHRYRRRGQDTFTREDFKKHLLIDRNGVIRATAISNTKLYYSLELIPFFARTADPTLGFSLLDFHDRLPDLSTITERLPSGETTTLDEDYAFVVGDYWGIDQEDVLEFLTDYEREYVETSLLPLPRVPDQDPYEEVVDRFRQVDGVYKRLQADPETIKQMATDFVDQFDRGQAGLAAYQTTSINLADLKWYASHSDDYELQQTIDEAIDEVAATLYPDRTPTEPEDDIEESSINIQDQIQLTLTEDPMTAMDLYLELPRDVRAVTDESQVASILGRLSDTNTICSNREVSPPEYWEDDTRSWE